MDYGIYFAFGAFLLWGFGDFLIQKTIRKIGTVFTLAWIGLFGSIILLPFVWNDLHMIKGSNLILIIGLGIITFIGGLLNFKALKEGKLSVVEIVLEIELPITIVLGIFFLGEYLNLFQGFLVLLILIGILLTSSKDLKLRFKIEKGVILGLLTGIFMAFTNLFTSVSSKTITPFIAIWGPWVVFTILTFILIFFINEKGFFKSMKKHYKFIIPTSIIDTTAWVCYAIALKSMAVSITTAITESYPVIALMLGVFINKEKIKKHQLLGAGISLVACIILAFSV
jgi:drug/metabolite transporter (DMT)-like permease